MPDMVRPADYFKVMTPNKAGEGARILRALRDAGVNLLAFTGFPAGKRAQLDFIPENTVQFIQGAKRAGLKLGKKKTCFLVQGEDRPGAIAEICAKLAHKKISVIALDGISAGQGRFAAILWVKPRDVAKAANAFGAS